MLTKTIPAYVYTTYQDDINIQAFNSAYNSMAQDMVDWFANIGLPIYTGDQIAGDLLDWVAEGLYGFERPSLPAGVSHDIGMLNSYAFNTLDFNHLKRIGSSTYYVATDDIFKRCITWNFYKGDGTVFSIRWLKRRIMRFLNGENGTDPGVNETYQISVTFGAANQVNISLVTGGAAITGGALFNRFAFNTLEFNSLSAVFTPATPIPLAPILKSAIDAGVLVLPFQFFYVVVY